MWTAALSLGMAKDRGLLWEMWSGVTRWGWAVAGKQDLQHATGRVPQKGKPCGGLTLVCIWLSGSKEGGEKEQKWTDGKRRG